MWTVYKAIVEGAKIDLKVARAEKALEAFPRGEMGMVDVTLPGYREARAKFDKAFKELQDFNKSVPKEILKEKARLKRIVK
jgi:hypothetical protein